MNLIKPHGGELKNLLTKELGSIREQGLYKDERIILGPMPVAISPTQKKGCRCKHVLSHTS